MEKFDRSASRRDLLRAGAVAAAVGVAWRSRLGGGLESVFAADDSPQFNPSASVSANQPGERGPATQAIPYPEPPPPPPKHWNAGDFIWRVDVPTAQMAFTFDDGPSPHNTDAILRALAAVGARATFFMIGVNVRAWPEIARRVRDAGHEIGNHSVYHTPYRASALAAQVGPNQQIIHDATGVWPVASRAPGLTRGAAMLDACATHNLYECHSDRDTSDWRSPRWSVSRLQAQFSGFLHPGWFGLYHDGGEPRPTRDAVPGMIAMARNRGYEFKTATDMVNGGTPRPGLRAYVNAFDEAMPMTESALADDTVEHRCGYDAKAELLARLEEPTVKSAERSRIVEVLADLDQYEREQADESAG